MNRVKVRRASERIVAAPDSPIRSRWSETATKSKPTRVADAVPASMKKFCQPATADEKVVCTSLLLSAGQRPLTSIACMTLARLSESSLNPHIVQ
jgi:hypothetical protein